MSWIKLKTPTFVSILNTMNKRESQEFEIDHITDKHISTDLDKRKTNVMTIMFEGFGCNVVSSNVCIWKPAWL